MARSDPQVNLRIPEELKKALDEAAERSGRSLTAEIVMRLKSTFSPSARSDVTRVPAGRSIRILGAGDGNGFIIEEYDRVAGPPPAAPPGAYVPIDEE